MARARKEACRSTYAQPFAELRTRTGTGRDAKGCTRWPLQLAPGSCMCGVKLQALQIAAAMYGQTAARLSFRCQCSNHNTA
eukprot:362984-Chlamydomonas_euryale.AAC.5